MIRKKGKLIFEVAGERIEVDTTISDNGEWGMQHNDITVTEKTRAEAIAAFQAELEKKADKKKKKGKNDKTVYPGA